MKQDWALKSSWDQCHRPVISAIPEAEPEEEQAQGQLGGLSKTLFQSKKKPGDGGSMVEHFSSMYEALGLVFSDTV